MSNICFLNYIIQGSEKKTSEKFFFIITCLLANVKKMIFQNVLFNRLLNGNKTITKMWVKSIVASLVTARNWNWMWAKISEKVAKGSWYKEQKDQNVSHTTANIQNRRQLYFGHIIFQTMCNIINLNHRFCSSVILAQKDPVRRSKKCWIRASAAQQDNSDGDLQT